MKTDFDEKFAAVGMVFHNNLAEDILPFFVGFPDKDGKRIVASLPRDFPINGEAPIGCKVVVRKLSTDEKGRPSIKHFDYILARPESTCISLESDLLPLANDIAKPSNFVGFREDLKPEIIMISVERAIQHAIGRLQDAGYGDKDGALDEVLEKAYRLGITMEDKMSSTTIEHYLDPDNRETTHGDEVDKGLCQQLNSLTAGDKIVRQNACTTIIGAVREANKSSMTNSMKHD